MIIANYLFELISGYFSSHFVSTHLKKYFSYCYQICSVGHWVDSLLGIFFLRGGGGGAMVAIGN